ncbi:SPX domain-containing protein 4 [Nymphaea thermarum]|nr:SPX domain-containing protein 4 [Nymphaea thermarum]
MKFGKEFRTHLEETLPEWRDKFLSYKPLKKLLKQISLPNSSSPRPPDFYSWLDGNDPPPPIGVAAIDRDHEAGGNGAAGEVPGGIDAGGRAGVGISPPRGEGRGRSTVLEEWFVGLLDRELEKFNDFYVDKEEEFVIRLQELKERIERVKEKTNGDGHFRSESEFSEEMIDIRKDFVTIHGEMVLLQNYSSLNFAGLIKILKKYDKRTGALLRLPFTQRALHQPFFTTEPLTRLVRECEANLELLFPLEAEVVEPQMHSQVKDGSSSTEGPASLQEDTVEIYKSTLAAMRTIQGLRKASSTCNPLSFASFFHNRDNDECGEVTTDNSSSKNDHETSFPVSKT